MQPLYNTDKESAIRNDNQLDGFNRPYCCIKLGINDFPDIAQLENDIIDKIPYEGQCAIIVAGCRDYTDKIEITKYISYLVSNVLNQVIRLDNVRIVEGGARGVDLIAKEVGDFLGIIVREFPANWEQFGKTAGHIRNESMAKFASKYCGILLAFWDGKSKGTKNMISVAKKYGIPTIVVQFNED